LFRRLPSLLATVLALSLALGAAPSAQARPASEIAGVATHPWQVQLPDARERTFAGIAATGAKWVRIDLPWSWVEEHGPTVRNGKGSWSQIDAIFGVAKQHGLKPIPILAYTPRWASPSGELWAFPYAEPFETFFAAALRRYPWIQAWELWNEPNFARFSKPRPDPAAFVEFLRSARRARDSVGSTAKLISGGLAPGGDIDVDDWIDQVAIRGGLNLIDGLGIHPYSSVSPDDPRSWMMHLQELHERLARLGRPDLPLWLTEYGAPSVPVANGYAPALTEQDQADRLRTAFALAARFDWIENLTWYEYRDSCADRTEPECNFGLVRADMSHKPAYNALRDAIAGVTAPLRPSLLLSTKIREARVPVSARASKRSKGRPAKRQASKRRAAKRRSVKRIKVNRITVSGRLTLPGTQWPNTLLTVLLPRSGGRQKAVRVVVKEGLFWARFEGRDLRSGTLEARFAGLDGYQPLTAQIQVTTSVTTIR
jgi:polysaccharide biosynthesis protein PslG